jgi:hypothetical protein
MKKKTAEVRLKQLVIAPFTTQMGSSYSTLGLGEDGIVYRFDPQCDGWIEWSMKKAGCRMQHKGRR